MKIRRETTIGIVAGAALTIACVLAPGFLRNAEFARAEQQVEASRQQIANVQDMAAVFKAVSKAVEPSVVSIQVTRKVNVPTPRFHDNDMLRRFFRDQDGDGEGDVPEGFRFDVPDMPRQFEQEGTGSGAIMDYDGKTGWILTNNHVAGGASEMVITLWDGREIEKAKVVGTDPKTDLAVIQIEADNLIPAKWGDSDTLSKGDFVLAFGSPFGYVGSMTHGIVSALNRQAGIIARSNRFAYENFIQVDAPINPGNSGGPLANLNGEVVGINTAIATANGGFQGLGFAIPSNQAKYVYDAIKSKGRVVRGWLGVEITDVSRAIEEAKALGYTQRSGIMVKGLMNNTPATDKLAVGDIIVGLNGKKVENVNELRNQIAATAPGTEVTLTVFRDKSEKQVKLKLGEQPDDLGAVASAQDRGQAPGDTSKGSAEALGVNVTAPSPEVLQRFGLSEDIEGAVVANVKVDSLAARAGLRRGDVITRIDSTKITSPDGLKEALADKDLSDGVRIYWTNREGSRFAFVKAGEE